jgi:hypothetical protein
MKLPKKHYSSIEEIMTLLFWQQNNNGDLFVVLDAWEALNMAQ